MLLNIQALVQSNDLLPDEELDQLNAQRSLIQEQLNTIQASLERQTLEDGTNSSAPVSPSAYGRRRKQLLAELSAYDTILAPHKRLPAELLSQIFIHAYPDGTFIPIQRRCSPVILSHVCSRWRSIALETPELWTDLILRFAAYTLLDPPRVIDVAEEWFKRGGDRTTKSLVLMNQLPSSLSKTSKWDQKELLLSLLNRLVRPLAPTLRRLHLVLPHSILRRLFSSETTFPQLRELSLVYQPAFGEVETSPFRSRQTMLNKANLPQLVNIEFTGFSGFLRPKSLLDLPLGTFTRLNIRDTKFSLNECHDLLRKCRVLEECELSVSLRRDDAPDPVGQLLLPHLLLLSVSVSLPRVGFNLFANNHADVGSFFLPLVAPGLKTLTISASDWSTSSGCWGFERFMMFLAQSGSALEILEADLPFAYSAQRSASQVEVIVAALPSLVELRLPTHHNGGSLGQTLVSQIGEGNVLPGLKILIGRVASLQSLLDLLDRRWELSSNSSKEKSESGILSVSRLEYVTMDYEGPRITTGQAAHIDRLREKGIGIYVNHV